MRKFFLLIFLLSSPAMAQMGGGMPPHEGVETGVIAGKLFELHEGKKQTLFAHHTVVIMVFKDGQRILMLDKETDDQGNFSFKNIFTDSSFAYAIGSMIDNNVYVMSDLHLKPGAKQLSVEFPIGPGSSYFMSQMSNGAAPGDQGMPPSADAPAPPEDSASSLFDKPYQKAAVGLSFLVLLLAFSFWRSKKSA